MRWPGRAGGGRRYSARVCVREGEGWSVREGVSRWRSLVTGASLPVAAAVVDQMQMQMRPLLFLALDGERGARLHKQQHGGLDAGPPSMFQVRFGQAASRTAPRMSALCLSRDVPSEWFEGCEWAMLVSRAVGADETAADGARGVFSESAGWPGMRLCCFFPSTQRVSHMKQANDAVGACQPALPMGDARQRPGRR
ncbi:hypothetical protein BDV95DRAFT_288148 [Massariosphaeria phaeospora]|uniref:Uncharacterized protein n=1 Tax=Massariosphaeria phaeospora TaxID=100035 RepID=A0A7C8MG06_9PLEO|nr:hypothetical protein BDV95DRAFT_288148 [Massariosphaeria phaeospora]